MDSKFSPPQAAPQPYSSFSAGQKRYIVFTASGAGLFSSLSAQIYFPALNALAKDLNVTSSLINLTVTSYMVSILSASPCTFTYLHEVLSKGSRANRR